MRLSDLVNLLASSKTKHVDSAALARALRMLPRAKKPPVPSEDTDFTAAQPAPSTPTSTSRR